MGWVSTTHQKRTKRGDNQISWLMEEPTPAKTTAEFGVRVVFVRTGNDVYGRDLGAACLISWNMRRSEGESENENEIAGNVANVDTCGHYRIAVLGCLWLEMMGLLSLMDATAQGLIFSGDDVEAR